MQRVAPVIFRKGSNQEATAHCETSVQFSRFPPENLGFMSRKKEQSLDSSFVETYDSKTFKDSIGGGIEPPDTPSEYASAEFYK